MKVKILYTALISLIAGGAMAQDCTFFFPQTEGTVWVRKGYDAKGNLQSVMSYQVDEVEILPSGQEVEADYVYTNPSGTIVNKGDNHWVWYSPNVGLVRTEQYDKNNVLQSYTVLEELK